VPDAPEYGYRTTASSRADHLDFRAEDELGSGAGPGGAVRAPARPRAGADRHVVGISENSTSTAQ
jgi:hypothetical protein